MDASKYVFSTELMSLSIGILFVILMLATKPKTTKLTKINYMCLFSSIITIVIEFMLMDAAAKNPSSHLMKINILCILYVASYLTVLAYIVCFLNRLSAEPIFTRILHHYFYLSLFVLYLIGSWHMIKYGQLYIVENNELVFKHYAEFHVMPGILAAIGCFISSIAKRKEIPRPIFHYILFFVPLDLIVLIGQMFVPNKFFMSMTYMFPACVFYILFHASPYDAATGCQNSDSFVTAIGKYLSKRKPYTICYVSITKLHNVEISVTGKEWVSMQRLYRETCRKVEYLHHGIYLFRIDPTTFAVLIDADDLKQKNEIISKIALIIDEQAQKAGVYDFYRIVVHNETEYVRTIASLNSFKRYLFELCENSPVPMYIATHADYEKFHQNYEVEQLLYDIRNEGDLSDERVVVMIQPIYSIKEEKFKTGEALMRLTSFGETISPALFIPISEKTDTIHCLTKIMLNKVCKEIKHLENEYSFDAVTVNCSSKELSNPDFHYEILNILKKNQVDPSKIRLELTESAMFGDISVTDQNIKKLTDAGIVFYLDDFGTGYSNLERIATCPLHTVKFDKSILYRAMEDKTMERVLSDMLIAFKKKGSHVLVEGVETEVQKNFCVKEGFEFIQGFYYSRPVPSAEFYKFLEKKQ